MAAVLDDRLWFPDPHRARRDGLVAVGGDLSVPRLLLAYRSGLFPWTANPPTWWSPDPRGIFEMDSFHIPRSLARTLKSGRYTVTVDQDFRSVILACAQVPRREGETWITPEFVAAYCSLHTMGHAHSVECWSGDDMVGGVYGVSAGGLFAGESMFHRSSDASKVALVGLMERLKKNGFVLFDTQMVTPTTQSLGAVEISRVEYLQRLRLAISQDCNF